MAQAQHPIYGEPPARGTPTWLRQRRTGIGGSDAAAVLGISPWRSALGVWESKRGLVPETDATERMLWGSRLERVVRAGFNADYGTHYTKPAGMLRHERWPFVIGNLDGLAGTRVLEVKTADYKSAQWGEPGTDAVPVHYYAQVQHYLLLTGGDLAELGVLFGGNRMERYEIPAHREFQEAMLDDEARLWQQVVTATPPAPDGSADAGAVLRRLYPDAVDQEIVATPQVAGYAAAYLAAKEKEAIATKEKDHAAQLMQEYMGARKKLVGPGFTATWSNRAGNVAWRQVAEALAVDQMAGSGRDAMAWLEEYAEPWRGAGSRTFTLTKRNTKE